MSKNKDEQCAGCGKDVGECFELCVECADALCDECFSEYETYCPACLEEQEQ